MQRTIRSCAWQCDQQGTDVFESSGVGCSVSMGRSLGDGSLPLRGALSSFGSLVKNWLGKDQYGTDSLGRDYRACRFSAGTRRLEARAADADANSGPDSSRAVGALVLLAVGMTSREVRPGLALRTDHHFRRQAHLIWLSGLLCAR